MITLGNLLYVIGYIVTCSSILYYILSGYDPIEHGFLSALNKSKSIMDFDDEIQLKKLNRQEKVGKIIAGSGILMLIISCILHCI